MTLNLNLPEDIEAILRRDDRDLEQAALEAFAVDEYRSRRLSDSQFRRMLNISRMQADELLKQHGVWLDYSFDDFEREGSPHDPGERQ